MPKTIQLTQTRTSTITKSRQRLRETIGHAIVNIAARRGLFPIDSFKSIKWNNRDILAIDTDNNDNDTNTASEFNLLINNDLLSSIDSGNIRDVLLILSNRIDNKPIEHYRLGILNCSSDTNNNQSTVAVSINQFKSNKSTSLNILQSQPIAPSDLISANNNHQLIHTVSVNEAIESTGALFERIMSVAGSIKPIDPAEVYWSIHNISTDSNPSNPDWYKGSNKFSSFTNMNRINQFIPDLVNTNTNIHHLPRNQEYVKSKSTAEAPLYSNTGEHGIAIEIRVLKENAIDEEQEQEQEQDPVEDNTEDNTVDNSDLESDNDNTDNNNDNSSIQSSIENDLRSNLSNYCIKGYSNCLHINSIRSKLNRKYNNIESKLIYRILRLLVNDGLLIKLDNSRFGESINISKDSDYDIYQINPNYNYNDNDNQSNLFSSAEAVTTLAQMPNQNTNKKRQLDSNSSSKSHPVANSTKRRTVSNQFKSKSKK